MSIEIKAVILKRSFWLGFFSWLLSLAAWGQVPDSTKAGRDTVRVGSSEMISIGDTLAPAKTTDTVRLDEKKTAQIRKIIPKKATVRSAILPGLGQAYNRQYWKIPIIYAGFGTIGYFINYMNGRTKFYREHWDKAYRSTTKTTQIEINGVSRTVAEGTLERGYNAFRRYRDLNVLLGVALWGLNVIDANVSAHLKTFDLTDDLSLRVQPSFGVGATPLTPALIAPGVRLSFNFKK
ncbi:DUF5683 domain-containing protein [Tellurirhabdus bombi]|uniref:DUF5683 domain-containing protein n=1 Tax=Tellurirhabdus bombi TaxID=2907205 RepID=UPI001F4462C9|nr:DUF5683 domain-containing protein [Tellurirhabdus bombi]